MGRYALRFNTIIEKPFSPPQMQTVCLFSEGIKSYLFNYFFSLIFFSAPIMSNVKSVG